MQGAAKLGTKESLLLGAVGPAVKVRSALGVKALGRGRLWAGRVGPFYPGGAEEDLQLARQAPRRLGVSHRRRAPKNHDPDRVRRFLPQDPQGLGRAR